MSILENIFNYFCIGGLIVCAVYIVFYILHWLALKSAEGVLREEKSKFTEEQNKFFQVQDQFESDKKLTLENIKSQNNFITIKQNEIKEKLINIDKLKSECEFKIAKITRENKKLSDSLTAARQRAKRLAKRSETEV